MTQPPLPDDARQCMQLGDAMRRQGNARGALAAYQKALQLDPNLPEASNHVAAMLTSSGQIHQAIDLFKRAIELRPNWAEAFSNLSTALHLIGQISEAVAAGKAAVQANPQLPAAHGNLVLTMCFESGIDEQTLFQEHRNWNDRHAVPLLRESLKHLNNRDPDRPLRIGYVSPDFREHPVAFFIEGLLASHDRQKFHIFCYSDALSPDLTTQRISRLATHWQPISGIDDAQLATLVRQHEIDILVDLTGHTSRNRLLTFARKPAPIQISYLGYPNSTGMDAIDYYVTDPIIDPPGLTERFFSENLARLPQTFACYQPPADAPPVSALPAVATGMVTFGAFCSLAKINEAVVDCWSKILLQIDHSRLLLAAGGLQDQAIANRFRQAFTRRGVDPKRLFLFSAQPFANYLAAHQQIDLLLDPFPIAGHTIVCHGLWMGVPSICLAGQTHRGRLSTSVMQNLELNDFVANSADDYVRVAVAKSKDTPLLGKLRTGMRERIRNSPLMANELFARNMESAYRTMWRQWCAS